MEFKKPNESSYVSYGALEMKATYQRNIIYGYVIVIGLAVLLIIYVCFFTEKANAVVIPNDPYWISMLSIEMFHSPPPYIIKVISESSNQSYEYVVILGVPRDDRNVDKRGRI